MNKSGIDYTNPVWILIEKLNSKANITEVVINGPDDIYVEKEGKFIPGFGHKVYKNEDPRATIIYMKAKEGRVPLAAFEKAYAVEALLEKQKGKKLPLNIDGAFAAGVLALGMDPSAAKALFVFGRVAGMGAHAIEEKAQHNGYWRLEESS